jgi:hypothetical protein
LEFLADRNLSPRTWNLSYALLRYQGYKHIHNHRVDTLLRMMGHTGEEVGKMKPARARRGLEISLNELRECGYIRGWSYGPQANDYFAQHVKILPPNGGSVSAHSGKENDVER